MVYLGKWLQQKWFPYKEFETNIYQPKTNSSPLEMDVWKLTSFWEGLISGDMLVLGRVWDF